MQPKYSLSQAVDGQQEFKAIVHFLFVECDAMAAQGMRDRRITCPCCQKYISPNSLNYYNKYSVLSTFISHATTCSSLRRSPRPPPGLAIDDRASAPNQPIYGGSVVAPSAAMPVGPVPPPLLPHAAAEPTYTFGARDVRESTDRMKWASPNPVPSTASSSGKGGGQGGQGADPWQNSGADPWQCAGGEQAPARSWQAPRAPAPGVQHPADREQDMASVARILERNARDKEFLNEVAAKVLKALFDEPGEDRRGWYTASETYTGRYRSWT